MAHTEEGWYYKQSQYIKESMKRLDKYYEEEMDKLKSELVRIREVVWD